MIASPRPLHPANLIELRRAALAPRAEITVRHDNGRIDNETLSVVEAEYLVWLLDCYGTERPGLSVKALCRKIEHVAQLRFEGAEEPEMVQEHRTLAMRRYGR